MAGEAATPMVPAGTTGGGMPARSGRWLMDGTLGWPLAAPALAVLTVVNAVPILWSAGMGFFRYNFFHARTPPRFVGLANYADQFTDAETWEHLRNTGLLMAGGVAAQVLVGTLLALLLHRPFAGRRVVLMLVLAPMLLSTVAVGTFFNLFYDPTFGLVSFIVRPFTGEPFVPLGTPAGAMVSLVVADAWMWSPFVMLMLLAGLDGVPESLREAALVDRASAWRRFTSVVWPSIRVVLPLAVLFRVIETFNSFDLVYTITNGGPGGATETLATLIYDTAFVTFQTGRASALANFSAFVVIVLVSLYARAIRGRSAA